MNQQQRAALVKRIDEVAESFTSYADKICMTRLLNEYSEDTALDIEADHMADCASIKTVAQSYKELIATVDDKEAEHLVCEYEESLRSFRRHSEQE